MAPCSRDPDIVGQFVVAQPQVLRDHRGVPGVGLRSENDLALAQVLVAFGGTGTTGWPAPSRRSTKCPCGRSFPICTSAGPRRVSTVSSGPSGAATDLPDPTRGVYLEAEGHEPGPDWVTELQAPAVADAKGDAPSPGRVPGSSIVVRDSCARVMPCSPTARISTFYRALALSSRSSGPLATGTDLPTAGTHVGGQGVSPMCQPVSVPPTRLPPHILLISTKGANPRYLAKMRGRISTIRPSPWRTVLLPQTSPRLHTSAPPRGQEPAESRQEGPDLSDPALRLWS